MNPRTQEFASPGFCIPYGNSGNMGAPGARPSDPACTAGHPPGPFQPFSIANFPGASRLSAIVYTRLTVLFVIARRCYAQR
jgi:hypothetical protein